MSRLPLKSATAMKASKGPFQPDESEALTLSAKLAAIRIEEAANESKKGQDKVVLKDAVSDAASEGEDVAQGDDVDDLRDNVDDGSGPSGVTHLLNDEDDGLIAYDSDEEAEEVSKGEIASRSRYPITFLIPEDFLPEVPRTQATIKGLVRIWKDELSDGALVTTTYQQLPSGFLYKKYYGHMQVTFDKASDANFVWRNQVELKCKNAAATTASDTTKIILKDPSLVLISTSGNREEWVCLQDSCEKAHGSSFEQAAHHALTQRHRHGAPKGGESLRLLKGKINLKHLKKDYGSAKTSSRIDRALVSAPLLPSLSEASHCRPLKGLSDHWFGVKVTFKISLQLCMGLGIWRCKAAEIGRPGAAKAVAAVREEHDKMGSGDFTALMRKMNMALKKYSTEERKRVKATLAHLDAAVAVLQQEVMRNPYCPTRKEELKVKESQLAAYLASEQERVSLMAGIKELREGELPGKLMSAKVKTREERTMITSLQWKGTVRKDSSGILEAASEFYAELFSEPTSTADSTFWPVAPDKMLGEEQSQLLVADWSEAEVKEALDGMAKGKSPGADGIPKEFFSQHWDSLGGDVIGFVKQFEETVVLPPAALEAVTVLLHKKGAKDQVQNYQPITQLNSTYKLVARVLANRMRKVLHKVISEEQYGFLPGRRLADGVSLIADIVDAAKCKDADWYLLLVDFQKAFDSVSRDYLFGTMERMGFPRKFVRCKGEPVAVSKGVRQGCLLAPYLFLCAVEPLCQEAIRRKLGISNPFGDRLAYLGYADDTTLVLKGKRQIGRAVKLLGEFGDKSGLRVNNDKSALLPLGKNLRKKPDKSSAFKWVRSNEAERVLGVWISPSEDASVTWEITLSRATAELVKWQIHFLTTSGRVAVVNGYINPILAFQAQVYPPPSEIWAKLVKLLHNFVTGNHSTAGKHFALWSQELLFKTRGEGGLGVRDPCAELGGLAARRIALLASQPLGLRADLALTALDKAAKSLKRSVLGDVIKVAEDGSRSLKTPQELERAFGGTEGAKLAKRIFDAAPDEWKQMLMAPVTARAVLTASKFVLKAGTSYGIWRIESVEDDLARAGKEMSDLAPAVAIALELQKKTSQLWCFNWGWHRCMHTDVWHRGYCDSGSPPHLHLPSSPFPLSGSSFPLSFWFFPLSSHLLLNPQQLVNLRALLGDKSSLISRTEMVFQSTQNPFRTCLHFQELEDLHVLLRGQAPSYNEDKDAKSGKKGGDREANEEDEELRAMVREEIGVVGGEQEALLRSAVRRILPRDEADSRGCIVEVRAGTGGDEAALFAADVFQMYQRFCAKRGWQFEVLDVTEIEKGGYK
ncbi:unnamed protein product, partial [Closterium sp. Yama58-4]